jgi:hypothetical protein
VSADVNGKDWAAVRINRREKGTEGQEFGDFGVLGAEGTVRFGVDPSPEALEFCARQWRAEASDCHTQHSAAGVTVVQCDCLILATWQTLM